MGFWNSYLGEYTPSRKVALFTLARHPNPGLRVQAIGVSEQTQQVQSEHNSQSVPRRLHDSSG